MIASRLKRAQNQTYEKAIQANLATEANVRNLGHKNFVQMAHYAVGLELWQDADGPQANEVKVHSGDRYSERGHLAGQDSDL